MELVTLYVLPALGCLFGVVGHFLKKIVEARQSDAGYSIRRQFTEKPYKSMLTFFYAGAGLAGLYMAGDVSVYSAVVVGFASNSLSGAGEK